MNTSTSFVRERCGTFFRPRLSAQVICYFGLKTISFAFFTLFFSRVFLEKIRVIIATMLYVDETLYEEDFSMIFDGIKLTFLNLVFVRTTFPQNVVVDERPTSFPPALQITDNYACGLCQANKIVFAFVLVLGSKAL